jgi:protein associated with RNAse G/E
LERITINARKFDGTVHRSWGASLVERNGDLLVLEGVFDSTVDHPEIGVIRPGTVSLEYYWLDRCYNIFKFSEPEGDLKCFYCNINLPPTFESGVLDYIDLDIDVLHVPGCGTRILDEEEFERNATLFGYGNSIRQVVRESLSTVLGMIDRGEHPFDVSNAATGAQSATAEA